MRCPRSPSRSASPLSCVPSSSTGRVSAGSGPPWRCIIAKTLCAERGSSHPTLVPIGRRLRQIQPGLIPRIGKLGLPAIDEIVERLQSRRIDRWPLVLSQQTLPALVSPLGGVPGALFLPLLDAARIRERRFVD